MTLPRNIAGCYLTSFFSIDNWYMPGPGLFFWTEVVFVLVARRVKNQLHNYKSRTHWKCLLTLCSKREFRKGKRVKHSIKSRETSIITIFQEICWWFSTGFVFCFLFRKKTPVQYWNEKRLWRKSELMFYSLFSCRFWLGGWGDVMKSTLYMFTALLFSLAPGQNTCS